MISVVKAATPWLIPYKRSLNSKATLLCFHHAGGGASAFRNWKKYLPREIDLVAVQLPGREHRFNDAYITSMDALINELFQSIRAEFKRPYILYGHSMGAVIAYEMVRKISDAIEPPPLFFIPTGRMAPQCIVKECKNLHKLEDDDFCREFLERYYSDRLKSIFDERGLRNFFLPQLRADMELLETYQTKSWIVMDCPIMAVAGTEETDISESDLAAWRDHTNHNFASYRLPGGHFFIEKSEQELVNLICEYSIVRLKGIS
jgi:medium-chain acyl-[acyl-carrier-protein] hydrolase